MSFIHMAQINVLPMLETVVLVLLAIIVIGRLAVYFTLDILGMASTGSVSNQCKKLLI